MMVIPVPVVVDLLSELLSLTLAPHPAPAPLPTSTPTAPVSSAPTATLPAAFNTIPDDCLTFVDSEEIDSPTYYAAHYTHFEWPGGASGPTIAIGYDCGYVTAEEARADWNGIVSGVTIEAIVRAVGLRGTAAQAFVAAYRDSITISWDQARTQFAQHEVPKWLARCRAVLPHFDDLPGECRGALFSLSYNRGTGGYDDPGPRFAEMRAIKAHMTAKNYAAIPADVLSMQRLWPKGGDLWRRRAHEAALFRKGLGV